MLIIVAIVHFVLMYFVSLAFAKHFRQSLGKDHLGFSISVKILKVFRASQQVHKYTHYYHLTLNHMDLVRTKFNSGTGLLPVRVNKKSCIHVIVLGSNGDTF